MSSPRLQRVSLLFSEFDVSISFFKNYCCVNSVMLPGVLKSENENPSQVQVQVQDLLAQEATEISDSEELLGVDQAYIEGRMDMESTDYPGTGANNHHDPKTPGRA
ncbi:putative Transmembrane protein [Melia azedarach]|uniref:Transmembrane protein n=1 Tax=Melia azedarach TaxID=155640 RepID=A0ACC1YD95_MELAZ|nr:putative Transmembrane protein [Melia azedarach]